MRAIGPLGQRQRFAVGPRNVREGHVRVGHQAVGLLGGGQHFAGARQQGFFGGGEHVRLVAQHLQQRAPAILQFRRLQPRADFRFGMRQQFGSDPGAFGGDLGVAGTDARLARLVRVLDGVLVVAQVRVGVQALQQAVELRLGGQQARDGRGGIQLALHRQHRRGGGIEAREIRVPRFGRDIQRGQVPRQGLGHPAPGRHGIGFGMFVHAAYSPQIEADLQEKTSSALASAGRCPMLPA